MNRAVFVAREREAQSAFFSRTCPDAVGCEGSPYRLKQDRKSLNLAPAIRDRAARYFGDHHITWHRHVNHGLSSQVCCLNFLMPLAEEPELLAKLVGHALDIAPPEMLRIRETDDEDGAFVGFEWVGKQSYLNEARHGARLTRGANATSADAILRFRHDGRDETLLVEWKYTEAYGAPTTKSGNPTRLARYKDIAFMPDGPIRNDLGLELKHFFWEPFYQLLRQQILADRMQKQREDGAERVRVLHIAPAANNALLNITSRELRKLGAQTAFAAFKATLADPDAFVSKATEDLFAPLLADPRASDWASYISDRYTFVRGAQN